MRLAQYPALEIGVTSLATASGEGGRVSRTPWWLSEALIWEREAFAYAETPSLRGHVYADVAIVGGGYTGLWTALELLDREPTLQVVVLEQAICGYGASGRNGGLVAGYWRYLPKLVSMFGEQTAIEVAQAGVKAQGAIERLIRDTGMDVWWRNTGHLKVATLPSEEAKLDIIANQAQQLGYPEQAALMDASDVSRYCASPVFQRGIYFSEGATVQPARLARVLRREVLARGGRIYENSGVVSISEGGELKLHTASGLVHVSDVVLATNSALSSSPLVRRHVTAFSSHIALTPPVPELLERYGWTSAVGVFDTMMFPHYFRTTPDGRIAMGSGSGGIGRYGRMGPDLFIDDHTTIRAARALSRMFPDSIGRISHAWGGPIDVSADSLPFFGTDPSGHIHFAAGYSGHGVNPSWIGGQSLASLVLRTDDEWTQSVFCRRSIPNFPPEPARTCGARMIRGAIVNKEEALQAGRSPRVIDLAAAALPRLLRMPLGTR